MRAFTQNSKTILSVDFDRFTTCPQICNYCYVGNMERIYPAYKQKIERNANWAKDNPDNFAETLNNEYKKLRKSDAKIFKNLEKLPVRIYGSGDYHPIHFKWLEKLEFKFYIISKSLTNAILEKELEKLLELKNLTKITLSFDAENIHNYFKCLKFFGKDKINFAYTGIADDFNVLKLKGYEFNIFFNISDKKIEQEKSRKIKEQCPCDSKLIEHNESCTKCNKCWRSSITKQSGWNTIL